MKKKVFALLLVMGMLTTLLAGCGGSSVAYDKAEAQEAPAAPEVEYGMMADSSAAGASVSVTNQKLIKRVSMETETEDLDAVLPQVNAKVGELGGYVESQELYNGSSYSSYRSRSVNMTVRIPAERLADFTNQVEGISNVTSYTQTSDDVTLQYVDTESRVKALEVEQQRLMELLENAETMADLLEIESRLTDVRYELESYASQLRTLENLVNYATVNLYIRQVKTYTEVEPLTVWQRIGSGFKKNLSGIGEDLTDFFVWIVTYSPQLIFWALVLSGGAVLLKKKFKKRKVARAPREIPENKE